MAQSSNKCGTQIYDSLLRANYDKIESVESFEQRIQQYINQKKSLKTQDSSKKYFIPVIIHIVHNGEKVGLGPNLPYAQILSQIQVLNEDFNRIPNSRGYNTSLVGATTSIEWVLATHDPNGNLLEEPGVERIKGTNTEWTFGKTDLILKPSTIWDPLKYCNIWVVNFGGITGRGLLGYAQFPVLSNLSGLDFGDETADKDGIVVQYNNFGSRDKYNSALLTGVYNRGRTTTHELGHWLGLRHIWGDGDCSVDDFVDDTPNANGPTFGCPNDLKSCSGGRAMFNNYMDYTNDACMNIFTLGQAERMYAVLENSPRRKELLNNTQYQRVNPVVVSNQIFEYTSEIKIYPNPIDDNLNIEINNSAKNVSVEVRDMLGKIVFSEKISSETNSFKINLGSLDLGIFLLKIETDVNEIPHYEKIIKN